MDEVEVAVKGNVEEKFNLAYNKTYEKSPLFRQSNVTWDWDETFPEAYPDEGGITLTDGKTNSLNDLNDAAWVGFNSKTPVLENNYNFIRVDLGEVYGLTQLDLHVGSNGLGYGITAPNVEFFVSEDGETYTSVGTANGANGGAYTELLSVECEVNARYVEARITSIGWAFVSEIYAYGGEAFTDTEPTPDPDPVVMKGDVNGNDEIDSVDYTMLKRGYFGTYNVEMNVGDINGNEEIDSIDYAMLKRAYFGIYQIQ
ncbi:MAG: discoidin domain-containing protein [Clostridia bacterium]|nr:discoidin domain-containing protein [Clostridia bacterium]